MSAIGRFRDFRAEHFAKNALGMAGDPLSCAPVRICATKLRGRQSSAIPSSRGVSPTTDSIREAAAFISWAFPSARTELCSRTSGWNLKVRCGCRRPSIWKTRACITRNTNQSKAAIGSGQLISSMYRRLKGGPGVKEGERGRARSSFTWGRTAVHKVRYPLVADIDVRQHRAEAP